jgi:glycine/D-amino acid oxidase-like deaminating enzyme
MNPQRVAVLGAGMQGACVALELAARGSRVALVEQDAVPLNRASLRNEGKIHLGLVYAQAPTAATARRMLQGALTFRVLLSRWTGGVLRRPRTSTRFQYLVPCDSLRSLRELEVHYETVQRLYEEERHRGDADYLGDDPARLWRPLEEREYAAHAAAERLLGGFSTVEAAIDVPQTAAALRAAVAAHPLVSQHMNHHVRAVVRSPVGFRVHGVGPDGRAWSLECDQVVNALWDGRLVVDEALGLCPNRPWVHRLKYRVLVELPPRLRRIPSMTFVLGAYGDVVTYDRGPAYVSWYPECMRGWSAETCAPAEWTPACRGAVPASEQAELGRRTLRAFDALVPGLAESRILTVDAGVIFAWGERDITDGESELHRRDEIGVRSVDGYHSVNTGKLTTAPMFAVEAANRVLTPAAPSERHAAAR